MRKKQIKKMLLLLGTVPLMTVMLPKETAFAAARYEASTGDELTLANEDIQTTGQRNSALSANNGGTIVMNGGSILGTDTGYEGIINAQLGGKITLDGVDVTTVPSVVGGGTQETGIWVKNAGTEVTMKNGKLTTEGYYSPAIWAVDNSYVKLENVDVTTKGQYAYGISVSSGATVEMVNGSIETFDNGTKDDVYYASYGVFADNGNANLTNVDIITHGDNEHVGANQISGAFGIGAQYDAVVTMTGGSIQTEGRYSYGIASVMAEVNVTGLSVLKTSGRSSHGAYAYGPGSYIGVKNSNIITEGIYASGVYSAGGANVETTGGTITTSGEGAYGSWVADQSFMTLENVNIKTSGAGSHGVYAANSGEMTLKGATIEAAGTDAYAIYGKGQAGKVAQVKGESGNYQIKGTIFADQYSNVDLTFGAGSILTGATKVDLDENTSTADLNLTMTGSQWNMTEDSTVTALNFQGASSRVNFANSGGFGTLTTNSLEGADGHFFMRTDIQALQGDLLVAKDTGMHGGSHKITVANNGSASVDGTERLTIVDTEIGNATFQLTNTVELGGYQYNLRQVPEDIMDWELYASGKTPSGDANAGVQLFSGSYLLNYAETQTLIKRLGDLRKNDFLQEGEKDRDRAIWARGFGGKFTSSSDGFLHGFDMNYWGIQAGYDKRIDRDDKKGVVYVGGFLGYSKGNLDYLNNGSGSIESKSLGAYWTHIHRNGFYADAVFKYNWMKNDFKNLDSAGKGVRGDDIDTQGFNVSLELGRRYFFDKTDENGEKIKAENREGWYVEPQVQLTLGHQNGGRFTTSSGLRIKSDSYRSVLGRAEIHLGYEVKSGKNPVNVYGKLGVMKEFDGDVDYYLNGSPEKTSYGDTWKLWGVGVTAQFSQKHNLYLEVEKATGGQFNQKWGINGGYRFQW